MRAYYILAEFETGGSEVVGIYTGRDEFDEALDNAPDTPGIEYETGELDVNKPILNLRG